jgi:NADPH2:quinone reductase
VLAEHAIRLPDDVPFDQGAVLGIPGITGHRAVFADGPVDGRYLLVTGAIGAVGRAAVAVAHRAGATVIATVRNPDQVDAAREAGAHHVLDSSRSTADLVADVSKITGGRGVDRIADLAFDANIVSYVEMAAYHAVIATYATVGAEPAVPYWPMAFKNLTVRFLSNDDFPEAANQRAAADLTAALVAGDLHYPIAARYPLERIAEAHETVVRLGGAGRVVLDLTEASA